MMQRRIREIKSRIAIANVVLNKKKDSFHHQTGRKFKAETTAMPYFGAKYGAETWKLREVNQKHL